MFINRERVKQAIPFIDTHVAARQRVLDIPGVVVALRLDDELLMSEAYGWANLERREPMTPEHIFRVASHSKMFTATAIMQLVEAGRVRLDDRLDAYVDGIPKAVGRATVRQVLNHSAGIVRDGAAADYWELHYVFPDTERLVALSEGILAPNEHYKYSNIGYSLLGMVVETASGKTYNEYVTESIVDRLGLQNTGPEFDGKAERRLVTGYTGPDFPLPRLSIPNIGTGAMSAATGFYSTAKDLTSFAAAHFFGNTELLTDDSKREMQQPYWETGTADRFYGLGFAVENVGDRRVAGHGGRFPGHSTNTRFDATDRLATSVLTNETSGHAATISKVIFKILDLALRATPYDGDVREKNVDGFTGTFANLSDVTCIVQLRDTLYSLKPSIEDPTSEVTELEVVESDTLRIKKTSYGSLGESIRFIRNTSGSVVEMVYAGVTYYPVDVLSERFRDGVAAPV